MSVSGISSYTNTNGVSTDNRSSNSKNIDTGLSVTDFLSLIASQLQNQDMMNPMKDTEFISQLAQFTQLQATQNLVDINTTSYAASLIGKEVTAATMKSGELESKSGIVTGVSLFEGRPIIYIDKTSYELSQIMTVGKFPEAEETTTEDTKTEEKPVENTPQTTEGETTE